MKIKLLLLSLLALTPVFPQQGPFEFEISPRNFTFNFDRNTNVLSSTQKVVIKNITAAGTIFRINTAFGDYIKVDRNIGYLYPNESTEVNFLVSASNLVIGNYSLSASIFAANNVLSVPITFNVNVFDTTPTPLRISSAIHVASGLGWKTRLEFYNPSSNLARIRLDIRNSNGYTSATTNLGNAGQFVVEVPSNAARYVEFADAVSPDTLYYNVEVFTLNGVQVSGNATYVNAQSQEAAIPLQSVNNSAERVIAFNETNPFTTGIAYKNESDFWNTFTFEVFDEFGQQIDLRLLIFEPRSQKALPLKSLVNNISNKRGFIKVKAQHQFNIFALRFNQTNSAFLPNLPF